jgi:2-polyprenyl-3-methyl-5-hydroxy-6-metoxy-1,4-benzoquinol methylase
MNFSTYEHPCLYCNSGAHHLCVGDAYFDWINVYCICTCNRDNGCQIPGTVPTLDKLARTAPRSRESVFNQKEHTMPGKKATDGSGSKWTRMWVDQDLGNLNVRREQLAHLVHYKVNIKWMKEMARRLGRPINILNVGCGEANELRMFYAADHSKKADVIKSYIGLEGDPSCIARTEKKAGTVLRGCNGALHVCDITKGEFPVKPRSIDLVICNEVLEHIPRKAVPKVLKAIVRAMRPEAVLVLSTPNKQGTNDRLPADHVYEWGYQELRDAFAEAGLVVEDDLGVYIKRNNLKRYLTEHDPDTAEWADALWDRFGLDMGSIMTADLATPVANNVIHICRKADTSKPKKTKSKK